MSMPPIESRALRGTIARFGLPCMLLGAALAALVATTASPKELAAGGLTRSGADTDMDGLSDPQEVVLGTSPDAADTDADGFEDLEEVARRSDPLDPSSVPLPAAFSVGMYAHTNATGVVNIGAAIYSPDGKFSGLELEMGVVIHGKRLIAGPMTLANTTTGFVYETTYLPGGKIFVVELPAPARLVKKWGSLSVYSVVSDPDPAGPPPVLDATVLVDTAGIVSRVEAAPATVANGDGIIYRPLNGDGSVPPSWTSGQVCWQNMSAVGTNGASIVYEIDEADCIDMDSECSASECAATVGTALELPDPGSLLGG